MFLFRFLSGRVCIFFLLLLGSRRERLARLAHLPRLLRRAVHVPDELEHRGVASLLVHLGPGESKRVPLDVQARQPRRRRQRDRQNPQRARVDDESFQRDALFQIGHGFQFRVLAHVQTSQRDAFAERIRKLLQSVFARAQVFQTTKFAEIGKKRQFVAARVEDFQSNALGDVFGEKREMVPGEHQVG